VESHEPEVSMLCPVCTSERLALSERRGIEIDYCPSCRGVWLDRGELDKLIAGAGEAEREGPRDRGLDDDGHDGGGYGETAGGARRGRRESWLSELFEFGS
jgi:Zn-finger nucleic acid-binding protein